MVPRNVFSMLLMALPQSIELNVFLPKLRYCNHGNEY